jgi:hypothetical protein
MTPCTFEVKFSYGTQFLFGTLIFIPGEDGTLELLTQGPTPSQHEPIYGEAPYYPADPSTTSTSDGICSGFNPYAGSYYLATMMLQGHLIGAPIFQSSAGTSSSTSSGASTDRDSIEDYPEIRGSIYWNSTIEAHRISMVGPTKASSQNSSSRYPTIRGSEASDGRTSSNRVVRNLNLSFNTVQLQTIMESIQHLVPQDSPLVAWAQLGNEAVGQIIAAESSTDNHWGKPSIGNRSKDWAKCARSKEASSAISNRRLVEGDDR